MSFSARGNHRRDAPKRDRVEEAPPDLRATLLNLLEQNLGVLKAYRRVCRALNRIPDPDIWGDSYAAPELQRLVERLEWFEVFDLLEEVASGDSDRERVNQSFVRCGLAYEITGYLNESKIGLWDANSEDFAVGGIEYEALPKLVGHYAAVKEQYQRALDGLHGRPMNLEKAVSEALGSLEAVGRVLTGKTDFAAAMDAAFASRAHGRPLAESLKKLHGWASQLPGARHGRYTEPDLTVADASLAVRLCGVAITFLLDERP